MRFFLQINGQSEGPFSVEEIEDLHGAGRVNRSTPCRVETGGEWSSIYNLVPSAIWVTSPRNKPVPMRGDPPDRRRLSEKIFWIGLSCLIAVAFLIPVSVFVSDLFSPRDPMPRLQALAPSQVASNDLAGMQHAMRTDIEKLNRQMEASTNSAFRLFKFVMIVQVLLAIMGLMLFALWLWVLITVVTTEPEGSDKIVWTLVVVFTGPIGAAIYFFARHLKRGSDVYAR